MILTCKTSQKHCLPFWVYENQPRKPKQKKIMPKKYEPFDLSLLGLKKIPNHVAIIMDGNGRWAAKRNLEVIEGHKQGVKAVRDTVRTARRLGIKFLTLYSFSKDNWKRPESEVSALMKLLKKYVVTERRELLDNGIKFITTGDIEDLPQDVRKKIEETEKITSGCDAMTLNLAISYSGRREIVKCIKKAVEDVTSGTKDLNSINEKYLSDLMKLPDVDILIRTSGEMRVSDFLLWQISYAEIYITDVLWPDFRGVHLIEAIREFQERERRFGGRKRIN